MSATTVARNTIRRGPTGPLHGAPIKASTKCLGGVIAVKDSSGFFKEGATATGLLAVGVFSDTYDNSSGANGDIVGEVQEGIFVFGNSASGDLIAATDRGAPCFIVDNQTVAKTSNSGARSPAGLIWDVTTEGVHVKMSLQIAYEIAGIIAAT